MNSYMGAVVNWRTLWLIVAGDGAFFVGMMIAISPFLKDHGRKRSWPRIDPRAVQERSSDG